MESPKRRFDRAIFLAGVLGILAFTGLQFQNCAGTTGKQTLPCSGKNCITGTTSGSGLNPPTGGDSAGTPTGNSYGDFPATGTCKLTVNLGKDANNQDVLATDAEKNYTLDQATNSITQIVGSSNQYGWSMPMQGPMGTETDYVLYCMKQAQIKIDQLDSTQCLRSVNKRIIYTITIGAILKNGTPRTVLPYNQDLPCKGRPIISAKSNYVWPADKNPLHHSDPLAQPPTPSFLSLPPKTDPLNPSDFCLNEFGCSNNQNINLYQNGGMITRLYVNQYNTNYLNYLLYEKFNPAWTVKIKQIKFDAYYKVVADANATFTDCPDKKNGLQIWYTTTTTGLPHQDRDTFFNVVEVPNIPTSQFRTIELPAQTFVHPLKPNGFFFFKSCNALRFKNLEIELY